MDCIIATQSKMFRIRCMYVFCVYCVVWSGYIDCLLYVTQSGKTGLIVHVSRLDFSPKTQSYMNRLPNWLATFPKPSGDIYVQCGTLMELWSVAVCGCNALWC